MPQTEPAAPPDDTASRTGAQTQANAFAFARTAASGSLQSRLARYLANTGTCAAGSYMNVTPNFARRLTNASRSTG